MERITDSMMRKKRGIICAVILALIAVLVVLGYWQRNNLAALKLFMHHSGDDLVTQMEDSHQQMNDSVKDKTDISIRGLSEEEKQALKDNTLSRDEIIQGMVTPSKPVESPLLPANSAVELPSGPAVTPSAEVPAATPTPAATPAPAETPAVAPDREQLSKYLAELYVMQEEYSILLDQYNQSAIDDYTALPEKDRTTAAKYKIGLHYVNLAKAREKECDAKMADMESKIKALLVKLGEDTALVDEIHQTYLEEKALKKAYYMSLH